LNSLLGAAGETLIKNFEWLSLAAYRDQRGIWTCGWGHCAGVTSLTVCTPDQAEQWFLEDTQTAVNWLNRDIQVDLTQNQFDALVSFTFNVGVTAEGHSTMAALINKGDLASAALEFPKWNHVDGVVDQGLTRRRLAEQTLFLQA
jgi:lysozyme